MSDFLDIDYYPQLSNEVMRDLQRRLERSNSNDARILYSTYQTARLTDIVESFGLSAVEANELVIHHDGTADLPGKRFEGKPSYFEFLDYVRKGRG